MHDATYRNTILHHLDHSVIERLQLQPVALPLRQNLQSPEKTIDRIYFIESGVGSMTTAFEDGAQVEVGMFGYESVVGISALMGATKSLNRIFMQFAGNGYSSSLFAAKAEFKRNEIFHDLSLRYVQAQLTQLAQSAACNATHDHAQRLARWLLICADRANTDTLALSQEFIAEMMGSRRTTVTLAAGVLKSKGLIEYSRGSLHIMNVKGLEAQACECYMVVKDHLSNFTNFNTGFVV